MPRILSGLQPSGALHIGNYFGMIQRAIALQAEGEAFYFIANYHALTSVRDPEVLRENSRRVAIDFLACGFDPDRGTLFMQSDVPQVTELAWILSTVAPMGLLERAHSYKDKLARGMPATVGLFGYPVLMAADILIYDSDIVPVGKDQKQHIEITRDLAVKMNEQYGQSGRTGDFQTARTKHSGRDRNGSRPRRPEDEQELRQHHRHLRRRKGNAETRHEHRDRFKTGGSAERSGKIDNRSSLFALRFERRDRGDARKIQERAGPATAISRNSSSKNSGNILLPCANAAKNSWPTNSTSTTCSCAAPAAPTKSPKKS